MDKVYNTIALNTNNLEHSNSS